MYPFIKFEESVQVDEDFACAIGYQLKATLSFFGIRIGIRVPMQDNTGWTYTLKQVAARHLYYALRQRIKKVLHIRKEK